LPANGAGFVKIQRRLAEKGLLKGFAKKDGFLKLKEPEAK